MRERSALAGMGHVGRCDSVAGYCKQPLELLGRPNYMLALVLVHGPDGIWEGRVGGEQ